MNSMYLNKYTIVQTFKENPYQTIYIGTDNKNNQAVVINSISIKEDDLIWNSLEHTYEDIFKHLLHFEKIEDKVILVTKVEEGISLNVYLNDFSPNFKERARLIYQYLKEIIRYSNLPNNMQSILVSESQLTVNEGKISFDELIVFDENSFNSDGFQTTLNNIISVLKKLTSLQSVAYEELPLYMQIMGFLDDLQKNRGEYHHINEIFNKLESLNIPTLSEIDTHENILNSMVQTTTPSNNLVGRRVGSIDESAIKMADINKKRISSIVIGTVGVATVALAGVLITKFAFPSDSNIQPDSKIASNKIIAPQELEKETDVEEAVTKDIPSVIAGPNDHISFTSEYVKEDFSNTKYRDYSFKISGSDSSSHQLSMNQSGIKANSQLLMWLKLDTDEEIKITFEGYSNNQLSFKQSIDHKSLRPHIWELVQLPIDTDIDEYVHIIFDDVEGTVWIDKISIDIFK